MFVDSHTHIFEERIKFETLNLENIGAMLVPAYKMENLLSTLKFCQTHKKCYCALGVHPMYAFEYDELFLINIIKENRNSIFAVGEIGLDSGCGISRELQESVFISQLKIARQFNLPITLHLRTEKDFADFFKIYKDFTDIKCAIYCFSGTKENLLKALSYGCFISFAGNITYKGRRDLRELIKFVPSEKLLIETDAPSMLPGVFARCGVNTSQNIVYVADMIAKMRECSIEKIARLTSENANNLFNLGLVKGETISKI